MEEKKSGRLVGVPKTSGELAEKRRFHRKNLRRLGLPKRKRDISSDCQIVRWERVKVIESRTSAKQRMIRTRACGGKSELHTIGRWLPGREVRASKENFLWIGGRKHEWVSRSKCSLGVSIECWFNSMSGQT